MTKWSPPEEPGLAIDSVAQEWIDRHMCQSRYLLQIVRCNDLTCCTTSRTNYAEVLRGKFIPPPIPLKVDRAGLKVHGEGKFWGLFQNLWLAHTTNTKVFDTHCPKMNVIKHQSGVSELNRRVCPRCGKYYPTLKALKANRSVCENIV